MISLVLTFLVFLALSGLMAAIDAAILSVTRPEISELIAARKWGARRLQSVKQSLTRAVVVIVILTNTINVLGPILVSQQAAATFGPESILVAIIALTLGTILFSEIIPKALGSHHAPFVARLSAPLIRFAGFVLFPLARALEALANLLKKGKRHIGTEEQIRAMAVIGRESGLIEGDELRMIQRAFVLNDLTAADLMTPLAEVSALSASRTVREAADEVSGQPISRFPVFGDSADEVCGVVMNRDIFETLFEGRGEAPVLSIARPAVVVDKTRRSDWLLVMFRDKHNHLAVVQDAGRTIGVVTLEDVLEELVGEIEDEQDFENRTQAANCGFAGFDGGKAFRS